MRLIDADKFVFEINIEISRRKEDDPTSRVLKAMITDIDNRPSVDAVPLDKLCLLLHDIAGIPCHTTTGEAMCDRLIGNQCNNKWDDVECWKQFLTKWMEKQNAAD